MSVVEPDEFVAARNKAADELIEELKRIATRMVTF